MKRLPSFYGSILRPWLCVVVYLWLLEFQAVAGAGFDPILDSLGDLIGILWTLIFWTVLFCIVLALGGLMVDHSRLTRANERVSRAACVIVSAFFLMRWLDAWRPASLEGQPGFWFFVTVVVAIYLLVRRLRKRAPDSSPSFIPSWNDCFSFGVLPLLLLSLVVLTIKSVNYFANARAPFAVTPAEAAAGNQNSPLLPNVIFIVADSMRAQSLSLYGNSAVPTPSLERFAAGASVYLESHSNSTMTGPSMTTLLTGKHPFTHGRLTREIAPRPDENNLLRILRNRGYSTAAITSNMEAALTSLALNSELTYPERFAFRFLPVSWLRNLGVYPTLHGDRMYRELSLILPFLGFPQRTSGDGYIENTLNQARDVTLHLRQPFSLVIHIHEPHVYYPTTFKVVKGIGKNLPSFYAYYDSALQPVVDVHRAEYEHSVRNVDSELGKFFDFLERHSSLNNSLIIVTADHGESFERGYLGHGEDLHENASRVPLIIRFPRQKTGERVAGLTQSIDIAPTILHALGIPLPDWMEGQPLIQGVLPKNRAIVTSNFKHPNEGVFYPLPTKLAVWWNQYKLIISCGAGSTEVYNLSTDPDERTNLAEKEGAVIELLKRQLKLQLARQLREPKLVCPNI
jgi:arylsulfatase A-like enzyme